MKIIVDKIPDNATDCLFSEYAGTGLCYCKLDRDNYPLCWNHECDKLIEVREIQTSGGSAWLRKQC